MLKIQSAGLCGVPSTQVSTCDAKSICTIKLQGLCWQACIGKGRSDGARLQARLWLCEDTRVELGLMEGVQYTVQIRYR